MTAEPLRSRQVARVWPLAAFYGLSWCVWLGLALNWTVGASEGWQPPSMPQPVIYGAIACVFLILAVRGFRIGVRVGEQGIAIRNVTSTRRIGWDEIERFEFGVPPRFAFEATCLVRRTDGTVRAAYSLGPPAGIDRWTHRAIARLNATLEERRRQSPPVGG